MPNEKEHTLNRGYEGSEATGIGSVENEFSDP